MAPSLPDRPSLTSIKKQAKALLRAWRDGAPDAQMRVRATHPKPETFASLRDAQLVLAREYGHAGWGDLRDAVAAAHLEAEPRAERVDALLRDACIYTESDSPRLRARAQRLLDADPSLATANVYTAAATGSTEALGRFIAADPRSARQPGGPNDWEPLMYLCYARLPKTDGDALEAARLLLEAGADPNVGVRFQDAYLFTAITGAMGEGEAGVENQPPHPRARALVELLLSYGANPNDSQGFYNTHFTPGNEWIELMLAHGLSTDDMINWDDGKRVLSSIDWMLGVAVTRGLADRVALLLDHGADPNERNTYDERCHYENALLFGHPEIAELLVSRGARRIDLSPASEFRAACMRGDRARARTLLEDDASLIDDPLLIHDAVQGASDEATLLIFDLGASLSAKGQHYGETPLHRAAINGRDAIVDRLVALGAPVDVRDDAFEATPVSWAFQGHHATLGERLLDRSEDVFDLATWGRVDQLRAQIGADASVANRTRAHGVGPLHRIEVGGERAAAVIDLLCEAGADPNAQTDNGTTPLEAALAREDDDVAELLRERGGRKAPG